MIAEVYHKNVFIYLNKYIQQVYYIIRMYKYYAGMYDILCYLKLRLPFILANIFLPNV